MSSMYKEIPDLISRARSNSWYAGLSYLTIDGSILPQDDVKNHQTSWTLRYNDANYVRYIKYNRELT